MSISVVTGGAGFIGSHLVEALLARGQRVRVLDNFTSGSLVNLVADCRLEILHSNINDSVSLERSTKGAEYVFHLATPSYASYNANMSLDRWAGTTDTL